MLRRHRFQWNASLAILFLLPLLLVPDLGWAQAPGTIRGTIRDKESGDLLDYANVLIKGTTRGTMSLGGGVFYFQGLAPGEYAIQVLYLGYAPQEKTITVRPGQTVDVAFNLEVVIVETLQTFDIEGARYMVEVKSAKTEQKIDADTFQKYAIDSVEDALAKRASSTSAAGARARSPCASTTSRWTIRWAAAPWRCRPSPWRPSRP
jgi:hypothetical protein